MNEIIVSNFKSLKTNRELKNQAMAMYMSGEFYPTEICDRLHVDINELGVYVFGENRLGTSKECWKFKKENGDIPKFISTYEKIKPLYIKKTEKKILDAVNTIMDNMVHEDNKEKLNDMDTRDLNNLVTAMEKIDKIGRLEEGKATTHTVTERTSFSLREIVKKRRTLPDVIVVSGDGNEK